MSELEQIAASVAKAFEMFGPEPCKGTSRKVYVSTCGLYDLWVDGSDLTSPEWQVRCRDWLLSGGYFTYLGNDGGSFMARVTRKKIDLNCHASEFCARAIHALTTDKTSERMR